MNLSQLEVLIAIVETGSFTEAAEVVGLTQSAASYAISKLEAELGVTLLERSRQGVVATRIGEDVVQHARSILGQIEIIRQKTAQERGLAIGKLRFGCVPTIPPRLLTGILRDFQQQYPDIEVILFEGTPQEQVHWLAEGVIDIGTVMMPDGYPLSALFVHDEIKVIVADNHTLATQASISTVQLAEEPLIGPKSEYGILHNLPVFAGRAPRLRYEVSTPSTIFAMVRENMGIALMLDMLMDAQAEHLVTLSLSPPLFVDLHLAASSPSPAAAAFLASAANWAKSHGFLPESA